MKLGSVTQQTPKTDEPNVAPLIDIVFILLIFFIVTSTFTRDLGVTVERPSAGTAEAIPAQITRVVVGRSGDIAVDGRPTSEWRLSAEVQDKLATSTEKSILIIADKAVSAEKLVEVMDMCRQGGALNIAVAAESI